MFFNFRICICNKIQYFLRVERFSLILRQIVKIEWPYYPFETDYKFEFILDKPFGLNLRIIYYSIISKPNQ